MNKRPNTRDRVLEVADQLLSEGIRPTQQNVRERIGSGSLTTINKALSDWWLSLSQRLNAQAQRPDLPEAVIQSANRLWDQALGYAEHSLNERRAELERHYRAQLEQLETQQADHSSQVERLQQHNTTLLSRNDQLSQKLQQMQNDAHEQERQIIQLSNQCEQLQRDLKARNLTQGQHGSSDERLELEVQVRILQDENRRLKHSNQSLADDKARLEQQVHQQALQALEEKHALQLALAHAQQSQS